MVIWHQTYPTTHHTMSKWCITELYLAASCYRNTVLYCRLSHYVSRVALAGTRNSSMGIDPSTHHAMSKWSITELHLAASPYLNTILYCRLSHYIRVGDSCGSLVVSFPVTPSYSSTIIKTSGCSTWRKRDGNKSGKESNWVELTLKLTLYFMNGYIGIENMFLRSLHSFGCLTEFSRLTMWKDASSQKLKY